VPRIVFIILHVEARYNPRRANWAFWLGGIAQSPVLFWRSRQRVQAHFATGAPPG